MKNLTLKCLLLAAATSISLATPSIDETELPLTEVSVFTGYVELPAESNSDFVPTKYKITTRVEQVLPQYEELKTAVKLPKPETIKTQIKCLKCN